MKIRIPALLVAAVVALPLLVGCPPPAPRGVVYARIAPPPAEVEIIGTAPGPEHVWIAGHHEWRGGAYVWVGGHWAARPRRGARWVAGHWRHTREGWYWVDGHWK
jgi:hypothetical protein